MTVNDPLDRDPVIRASRRAVTQQLRDSTSLLEEVLGGLAVPPVAGSGRQRLLEWCNDLPARTDAEARYRDAAATILIQGTENVAHLLMSTGDHARSLETTLLDGRAPRASVITLVRGCLEAALQVCFLMDSNVPPPATMLRAYAFQLASAEGNETIAASFASALRSTERLEQTREAVDGIHQWLDDAGFERKADSRNPRRTTNVGYGGKRVSLEFDVTAATNRYMPHAEYLYGVLSGAAHSRGWFISSIYDSRDTSEVTPLPELIQAAALSSLTIADPIIKTLGEHFGFPIETRLKATHARRHMLVRISRAQRGDLVVDYRAFHDPKQVQPHIAAGLQRPN
ncbi:hypothetical protein ACIRCZ_19020 [Leifsonia sp. NPDC102414]|uniref:hypothetical protein n=1 Tax=Leifsonia sp. NPDC102414 TaxID=3364124 RepID=UPI0038194A15